MESHGSGNNEGGIFDSWTILVVVAIGLFVFERSATGQISGGNFHESLYRLSHDATTSSDYSISLISYFTCSLLRKPAIS